MRGNELRNEMCLAEARRSRTHKKSIQICLSVLKCEDDVCVKKKIGLGSD